MVVDVSNAEQIKITTLKSLHGKRIKMWKKIIESFMLWGNENTVHDTITE